MTPAAWRAPTVVSQKPPTRPGLELVREMPLPGPANRFDYQSFDPSTRRIYMNHMNAGRTIVFDTDSNRVVTGIKDVVLTAVLALLMGGQTPARTTPAVLHTVAEIPHQAPCPDSFAASA